MKKNLEQDETIVWEKSEEKNYFYLPVVIITISACDALVIMIAIILNELLIYILMIGGTVITTVFVVVEDVNFYLRLKRYLHLSPKELKHYESFQVLTNKRFIERQINYTDTFPNYSEDSFKKIADRTFLNLNYVNLIIVQRLKNVIYFYTQDFIDKYGDTDFFVEVLDPYLYLRDTVYIYCKKDQNQFNKAFTALNSILLLEKIFQNQNGEIYAIKGKNVNINLVRKD